MKAAVRRAYGGVETVRIEDVPVPEPGPGQVLIEVGAAGIDRGTIHLLTGLPLLGRLAFGLRKPKQPVLGMGLAGAVAALGPGVGGFAVGDQVMGTGTGALSEFALAPASQIVHRPPSLDAVPAAAVPISGITAWQAIHEAGRVQHGQRVLVVGASGGVGTYAVQIAAAAGARVVAMCSAAKEDLVRSLGATEVLDYATQEPDAAGRHDVILDISGDRSPRELLRALEPAGTLVLVGGEGGGRMFGGLGRQARAVLGSVGRRHRAVMMVGADDAARLSALLAVVTEGKVRSAVERTFPLLDVAGALTHVDQGRACGKIVVTVKEASGG